jgi:hypothetical protein
MYRLVVTRQSCGVKIPKFRRRRRPVPGLWLNDEDDDEAARGGYLISIDPDAVPMHLTEPITAIRENHFWVSGPPDLLVPGQYYLVGGPGQSSCEVVQVDGSGWAPGQPRKVRRSMLKTIANLHPAGTPIRPVTARFVADWAQDDLQDCQGDFCTGEPGQLP